MPYSLITDTFETDPVWEVLSGGNGQLLDSLQASWVRMNTRSSHQLANGYLTEAAALACCRGRRMVLDKLTTAVLGRAPRLHSKGDECPCLGDEWIDGYTYRLHKFLKRNPSKQEYRRNAAQKADRRDSRLKAWVLERDGAFCRYCRSGPLSAKATRAIERRKVLQFDHPDPDRDAEGGANYVTACASCNEYKGHRTPFEADMELLDPPSPAQIRAWTERGLMLFDRPTVSGATSGETTDRINDEPTTNQRHVTDPVIDPGGGPDADPNTATVAEPRPETGVDQQEPATNQPSEGAGSGRVGSGVGGGSAPLGGHVSPDPYGQQPRAPDSPDIWTRRSRASPQAGGAGWTAGSTRRWRKIRAAKLEQNQLEHGGRCQLEIPDVCTGVATEVHHTLGRSVTGDDPKYLVASCKPCNLHVGDPSASNPPPRPMTRW